MIIQNFFLLLMFLTYTVQSLCNLPLAEQFKQTGYVELYDEHHGTATYDALYAHFEELLEFFQKNPVWTQKLYCAKERFIRSKERHFYSTDFFGLYDESKREGRGQVAFYYSTHFHDFICFHYKEFMTVEPIIRFFDACREIQKSYGSVFSQAAVELALPDIFSCADGQPPILFKVVKYLPSYRATKPHYDGTAFSLLLDSTDNQSLLLSAYKSSFIIDDFSAPARTFARSYNQNSILLIPGTLLKEFSIDPTPHIVAHSSSMRYAAIAFAMRPHYSAGKSEFSLLPNFNH